MYYPFIVAQYAITGHPRRTEHWSIVVMRSRNDARVFEIVGNYDSFAYVPRDSKSFASVLDYCGGCHVGNIEAIHGLPWMEARLKDVPVIRQDPDFDSQTWVVAALRLLRSDGVVFASMKEENVRAELAEDLERWETGQDTIDERLFPL